MTDNAQEPEAQVDALQHESDRLGEAIGDAREDWENKKSDAAVPGADSEVTRADPQNLGADGDLDAREPENEDL
jgi:hypothetical protein